LTSPITPTIPSLLVIMSGPRDATDDEIDVELAKAEQKMQEEMAEKRRVAQERKAALKKAKEEKARKVEEARQKAEAEHQAKEAQDKAERVHLANQKRLDQELIELKERTEAKAKRKAKEKEKNQAREGMMLATPVDLSALDRAWQINANNAKARVEGFKPPRAGSSKATPTPMLKTPVNLTRQVWEQERLMKPGKLGKTREVAVSAVFSLCSAFLTCIFQTVSCDMCKSCKDLCVYGSRVACQVYKECKVRCSFLDTK
jgi:hypothetical protein